MTTTPARSLRDLPKGHLHLHLDGCARPSTVGEFARRAGIAQPDLTSFRDLVEFLGAYRAACSLVRSVDDLQRICRELIEDEAAAGVVYCEPIFAPQYHVERLGMSPSEVFAAMDEAFRDAGARHGVTVGYLLGADRAMASGFLEDLAAFAAAHAERGVVGFGYGGDERVPHRKMRRACDIAREAGLMIVAHAGETVGAGDVTDVLDVIGPDRIAHGVGAIEDAAVLRRLAAEGVVCDVCPTSNVRLGVSASLAEHQLCAMVEAGVPLTLGADDSLFFGASVLDEYENARAMGLSDAQLAAIARTSLTASGADAGLITATLVAIERWLATPVQASAGAE